MDLQEQKLKLKPSSSVQKPRSFSFKDLGKIVKQASAHSSRRLMLQRIYEPSSPSKTRNPYKTFDRLSSPIDLSKSKRVKQKLSKIRNSETTVHLNSNLKRFDFLSKGSPRKGYLKSPSKISEKFLTKRKEMIKKPIKHDRKFVQSAFNLSFRTKTGSINGKPKPNNQDDFFVIHDFGNCKNQILIGVMDGHGLFGHDVSSFIKKQLPLLIESSMPNPTSEFKFGVEYLERLEFSFKEGYKNTQQALVNRKSLDTNYSGSTAVSLFLRDNLCICANLGDSRAIIGRYNEVWYPVELSNDHKPSNIYEKHRIQMAGGRVEPFKEQNGKFVGPDRVWLQHEQLPGLAMSRAFGDLVAANVGVISEPEITINTITETDKFIVVASDGVWEFLSDSECINIVAEFYLNNDIEKACDSLMKKAVERWNNEDTVVDDITFILVFLNLK